MKTVIWKKLWLKNAFIAIIVNWYLQIMLSLRYLLEIDKFCIYVCMGMLMLHSYEYKNLIWDVSLHSRNSLLYFDQIYIYNQVNDTIELGIACACDSILHIIRRSIYLYSVYILLDIWNFCQNWALPKFEKRKIYL